MRSRPGLGNLALLRLFDPEHFRAGNIHNKLSFWHDLLEKSPCSEVDLLEVISHSEGISKYRRTTPNTPPPIIINNSPTTAKFSQFVSDYIIQRVTAGVIAVWGLVDSVMPPHLVLPFDYRAV